MYPNSKSPSETAFKHLLEEISTPTSTRPSTPLSLKPFVLIYDPIALRLYSTIPPVPVSGAPLPAFSLTPKRNVKRDPWPREHAIDVHSHILRLREQYDRKSNERRVREFTAKTGHYFIFRTLVPTDERSLSDFAEGWYIVKTGSSQTTGSGLGRGDDAGGLEEIAKAGREKCRETFKAINIQYTNDSDQE
jgi:hypothetical protein